MAGGLSLNMLAPLPVPPAPAGLPRAVGAVVLSAVQARGAARIAGLRQSGSLKLLFPRRVGPALEAVLLNTAGGLTGGDRMEVEVTAGPGARVVMTTQAAERAYRALAGTEARVTVRLAVRAGARIDWLPQETIVYDGSALVRSLHLDLDPEGQALLVEPLIFGRAAMGEVLRAALLRDRWEVRCDGQLVFVDALRLEGDLAAQLQRPAVAGGAGAMASVLLVGPGAATGLAALRPLLPPGSGVSLLHDGLLFARLLAPDGLALRKLLIPVIETLSAAALPKVWRL